MSKTDVMIYGALVLYILYITYINNMWGVSRGANKAKADVRVEKQKLKNKKRGLKVLAFFVKVDDMIGSRINPIKSAEYQYKIDRIRWVIKSVDRSPKPSELAGMFKVLQISGVFLGLVGFFVTNNIIMASPVFILFAPLVFHGYASNKIIEEDMKIERDFPDLFLILYTRLVQGSDAKISPVLKEFLISLDATRNNDDTKDAIRHFVMDLSNNIEIYGDDTIAIRKLREKYRSVMVINFSNLAVQALSGVNNRDKLLTFKNELNQRKVEYMKKRADKMVKRGSYAIWGIYLILGQFIILSWVAKLSQAGTFSSLGIFG